MCLTKRKQDFELWVEKTPEVINYNTTSLPIAVSVRLDYSLGSLDVLEEHLISNFNLETIFLEENKSYFDFSARYVGETFKRNLPHSRWKINLEDKSHPYYGLPVITGSPDQRVDYSPYSLIVACLEGNSGKSLRTALKK